MADTSFDGYGGDAAIADTDVFLCKTAAGGGKNPKGSRFVRFDANGNVAVPGSGKTTTFGNAGSIGIVVTDALAAIPTNDVKCYVGALSAAGGGIQDGMFNGSLILSSRSSAAADIAFYTSATKRLQIEGAGSVRAGVDNSQSLGSASFRWATVYAGSASINTSDEREKQQIEAIPDAWLDAWADVAWSAFKFNDAVAAKGTTGARWHAGLIAQAVQAAFTAHGIDATEIGLLCHDEWPEVPATTEQLDADGNVIVPANPGSPAGDRYGLRYEECFAVEAAYQRRRMTAIEARLAALETPAS